MTTRATKPINEQVEALVAEVEADKRALADLEAEVEGKEIDQLAGVETYTDKAKKADAAKISELRGKVAEGERTLHLLRAAAQRQRTRQAEQDLAAAEAELPGAAAAVEELARQVGQCLASALNAAEACRAASIEHEALWARAEAASKALPDDAFPDPANAADSSGAATALRVVKAIHALKAEAESLDAAGHQVAYRRVLRRSMAEVPTLADDTLLACGVLAR